MATGPMQPVLDHIRRLAGDGESDQELLERFAAQHEAAVFEALLRRHGPMVLGVGQRVLNHRQDAEDVFQATFLVLARRAGSIRRGASLGSWLYGVAYRLALKVKARTARRRDHERRCAAMAQSDAREESAWEELRPVLDEELSRLPEKYRAPLVLCYLEGRTHAEAADVLGWAPGSMSRRLAQARDQLRARLVRRNVGLSAGMLATVLAGQAQAALSVPLVKACSQAAVLAATGQVVTSFVTVHAAALAEGAIRTMLASKMKTGLVLFVALATAAGATALAGRGKPAADDAKPQADAAPQAAAQVQPREEAKVPADVALVPGGAVGFARLGVHDIWTSKVMQRLRQQPAKSGLDILTQSEKNLGVPIDNIEAVTLILLPPAQQGPEQGLVAVFATTRPYSRDAVRAALLPNGKEEEYQGKTYYGDQRSAVYFASERLFVLGPTPALRNYLDAAAAPERPRSLSNAMKLAGRNHAVVAGFQMPEELRQEMTRRPLPPQAAFLKPLLDVRSGSLTVDINSEARARGRLQFADADKAEEAKDALETAVGVLKQQLAAAPAEARKDPFTALLLDEAGAALKTVQVRRQDGVVQVSLHTKAAFPLATFLPGIQKARANANFYVSANNLKQIAIAMHNYQDTYKHFPPAAIRDKNGKPLLSWRVAILPFVEQQELYKQFHLDEPWDSAHNKKLLTQMPKLYMPLNVEPKPGMTFYQVFTGKDTPFDNPDGDRITDITDGTSNTLLVVEGDEMVPWTKPQDLSYSPDKPLPKLGGHFPDFFVAAFCDGSVRRISKQVPEQTLRALITRSGGEVVDVTSLP